MKKRNRKRVNIALIIFWQLMLPILSILMGIKIQQLSAEIEAFYLNNEIDRIRDDEPITKQ